MRPYVVAMATLNTENDQTSREDLEWAAAVVASARRRNDFGKCFAGRFGQLQVIFLGGLAVPCNELFPNDNLRAVSLQSPGLTSLCQSLARQEASQEYLQKTLGRTIHKTPGEWTQAQ
ncbi:TPA: hypothetical protein ACH3X1_007183 [Trebouxia sp. C0004]